MPVQAHIDFFENFSSGASAAPTATRTADYNRDVPFLVAFFESITTSSIPTTTPPTQLCAHDAPRSATKIANVLPANEELSSSLPDTMVDHDEFVQSLYDMTVADDDQPAAEMAQTSTLAPFGAVVETDYHEEPTPISADAAKIKSWVHRIWYGDLRHLSYDYRWRQMQPAWSNTSPIQTQNHALSVPAVQALTDPRN